MLILIVHASAGPSAGRVDRRVQFDSYETFKTSLNMDYSDTDADQFWGYDAGIDGCVFAGGGLRSLESVVCTCSSLFDVGVRRDGYFSHLRRRRTLETKELWILARNIISSCPKPQ